MANANVLFNSPGGSQIAVGNLIQAPDFEKDGSLLYDPATTTLYLNNVNVGGNATGNIVASTGSTGSAKIPVGTTGQRDATPSTGFLRFNTTVPAGLEVYDGTAWQAIPFPTNAVLKTGLTGSAIMPAGTTAQQDATPAIGYLRYNTDAPAAFEYWDGTIWQKIATNSTAVLKTSNTGAAIIPTGTTGERPAANAVGYTRYNTTTPGLELWDGAAWTAVGGGGGGTSVQVFQTSGTWTVPAGVTAVTVSIFGGGGGGAGAQAYTPPVIPPGRGGDGGTGIYNVSGLVPGTSIAITVGGGGAGGATLQDGSSGGATSFGAFLTATGGSGGLATGTAGTPGTVSVSGAVTRLSTTSPAGANPGGQGQGDIAGNEGGAGGGAGMSGGGGGGGAGGPSSGSIPGNSVGGSARGPGSDGASVSASNNGGTGGGPAGGAGGTGAQPVGAGGGGGTGGIIIQW